jgi:hypothetical protein
MAFDDVSVLIPQSQALEILFVNENKRYFT